MITNIPYTCEKCRCQLHYGPRNYLYHKGHYFCKACFMKPKRRGRGRPISICKAEKKRVMEKP